jgi:hypothetical protein
VPTIRHWTGAAGQGRVGNVSAMPDERIDPSQNTQAFQAWVDNNNQRAPEPAKSRTPLWVGVGVAVAVVVVVVLFVALG